MAGADLAQVGRAARQQLGLELVDLTPHLALVRLPHGVQRRQRRARLLRQRLVLLQPEGHNAVKHF